MDGKDRAASGLGATPLGYPISENGFLPDNGPFSEIGPASDDAEVRRLADMLSPPPSPDADHLTLDPTNERILHLLAARGRNTVRHIAELVGESEAKVRERVAVLEARGVVMGYEARIDWALVGLPLLALFVAQCPPERSEDIAQHLRKLPNLVDAVVTQDVTGPAPSSIFALLRVRDLEEVQTVIPRLSSAGLANMRTRVALERVVTERHPIHSLKKYIAVMLQLPQFPARA